MLLTKLNRELIEIGLSWNTPFPEKLLDFKKRLLKLNLFKHKFI